MAYAAIKKDFQAMYLDKEAPKDGADVLPEFVFSGEIKELFGLISSESHEDEAPLICIRKEEDPRRSV